MVPMAASSWDIRELIFPMVSCITSRSFLVDLAETSEVHMALRRMPVRTAFLW